MRRPAIARSPRPAPGSATAFRRAYASRTGKAPAKIKQTAPARRNRHDSKDARRTAVKGQWGEEVVVGTGEVDWTAFVQILAGADFKGSYIFEREAGNNRLADITQGVSTLREVMGKASA